MVNHFVIVGIIENFRLREYENYSERCAGGSRRYTSESGQYEVVIVKYLMVYRV